MSHSLNPRVERLEGDSHEEEITALAFSPDRSLLASASWDRTINLWDVATYSHLSRLTGHEREVTTISFSPDGQVLASASWDRTVRLWPLPSPPHQSSSQSNRNQEPRILRGHAREVTALAFAPDSRTLASVSWSTIKFWDVATGEEFHPTKSSSEKEQLRQQQGQQHTKDISFISFSPNGQFLVSTSRDTTVRLWSTSTSEQLHVLEGNKLGLSDVAFSSVCHSSSTSSSSGTQEQQILAYTTRNKKIRLFDASTGEEELVISSNRSPGAMSFSPITNGKGSNILAASAGRSNSNCTIELWDAKTGDLLSTLDGCEEGITDLQFSPCGRWLASTCWDKTVTLWEVNTGRKVFEEGERYGEEVCAVAFSGNGNEVFVANSEDKEVVLTKVMLPESPTS